MLHNLLHIHRLNRLNSNLTVLRSLRLKKSPYKNHLHNQKLTSQPLVSTPHSMVTSLSKLLGICAARQVLATNFVSLFQQLSESQKIDDNEYVASMLEVSHNDNSGSQVSTYRKIELVLALSMSDTESMTRFWRLLTKCTASSQVEYLVQLNRMLVSKSFGGLNEPQLLKFVSWHLAAYTKYTATKYKNLGRLLTSVESRLLRELVFIWSTIHKKYKLPSADANKARECVEEFAADLHKLGLLQEHRYICTHIDVEARQKQVSETESITSTGNFTLVPATTSLSQDDGDLPLKHKAFTKSLSLANVNPRKLTQINKLKKYLWLSQQFKNFNFDNNDLMSNYATLFINENAKKPYAMTVEFVSTLFNGYGYINDYPFVKFNWKNYIVSQLPLSLSLLKFTEETVEESIVHAFKAIEERIFSSDEVIHIRQLLVKSCIFHNLLSIPSFHKIFPTETRVNQQYLVGELNVFNNSNLDVERGIEAKLLKVNPEFTSLDESGLIEFFATLQKNIECLHTKQMETTRVILKHVDELIRRKENDKLARLLLVILNNLTLLHIITYNSKNGPYKILNMLINYLDSKDFNIDDDAENFQDSYSYFGVFLLSVILILDTYQINFQKISYSNSYTLEYVSNFYYRLCDSLTNNEPSNVTEEDSTIINNYDSLLTEWVNALFDDSNDGLSDDLIKSVNIKQVNKLIPIIFQQAILATRSNVISFQHLSNGIDYLSQNFLMPCTLSVIKWVLSRISLEVCNNSSGKFDENIYVKVLYQLIKLNVSDDEDKLNSDTDMMFRMVINLVGHQIIKLLESFESFNTLLIGAEIVEKVRLKIDPNCNQLHCRIQPLKFKQMTLDFVLSSFNNNQSTQLPQLAQSPAENNADSLDKRMIPINFVNNNMVVSTLLDEVLQFQKRSNEDAKIFINLILYVLFLQAAATTDNKKYWTNRLTSTNVGLSSSRNSGDAMEIDDVESSLFTISLEDHYSSIFNIPGANVGEGEDDDDDLFNDNDTLSGNSEISLESLQLNRLTCLLASIISYIHKHRDDILNRKTILILADKVVEDMSAL